MSMTSPMMDLSGSVATDDNTQTCDSPSGSSTSEPHDDALPMQQPFIDQSFFYKLDQLSPDDPLYFMQQQQQQQRQHQQQQQQQQHNQIASYQSSVSPSPPPPSLSHSSIVDPLQPSSSSCTQSNATLWSGFNNILSNVANPLPQAIPNLTKNFTDYVAGYPIQQANQEKVSFKHDVALPGMQIRVLGVPQTGAKSRVETQIKLCIQLVTDDGDKAQWWSHLKLPEHMVARDKLKRQVILSPDGTSMTSIVAELDGANAPIPPEKTIFLKARVICASDPSRKVLTCLGCIQRERKRSQRRKENRAKTDQENKGALEDDKSLALEEQKILLFNCSEMVDFSSGDTILPTRITCYCRHHNERLGFCIYFEMQDHTGKQIATGMSPPIMITDDHKSNKLKSSRKRPRTDENTIGSSFDLRQISAGPLLPQPRFNPNQSIPQFQIQPRPDSNSRSPTINPSPGMTSPFRSPDRVTSPLPNQMAVVDKPCLQRLIPNEGPTFGGVEITLLGSGFRSGLTVMFGEVPASSTHYWSPNTLVCILPPVTVAGTVVVSFKEHPLVVDTQDVTLFTYYNENDRALMELALQVVGLKMTGKVEDAREIAMRIVQGGGSNGQADSNSSMISHNGHASLELHIIQILEVMSTFCDVEPADVSMATAQGHTMLHLAGILGFAKLTKRLIHMGCDMNRTDRNGYTALHYCCWYNHLNVLKVILNNDAEADAEISNMWNKKPIDLTTDPTIRHLLLNHIISDKDSLDTYSDDDDDDDDNDDDDISLEEEEEEEEEGSQDEWLSDYDDENSISSQELSDSAEILTANKGLRHRKRHTNNISSYTNTASSIQYLSPEASASVQSIDDVLDAEPLHHYKDDPNEMNWMQRTLSHFQPPNDSFLQNIKNNMPTKPSDINLKTIADHLLQLPRPMMANMAVLFSNENNDNKTQDSDQTLAWYMALAYAMGAGSLTQEESTDFSQESTPRSSFEEGSIEEIRARKRSDRRLYSFWVPMLFLMLFWLLYQFISSHPGVVDTMLSISGFRRQYLTIH